VTSKLRPDGGPQNCSFFDNAILSEDAPTVAPLLLGAVVLQPHTGLTAKIVETEAYMPDDPASHSFRGRSTRNATMFEPAGLWYAYFVYGMHWCLNVVTGPSGSGQAVLIRAGVIQPICGPAPSLAPPVVLAGPALFARAFGVDRSIDGTSCFGGGELVLLSQGDPDSVDRRTRRVGVSAAKDTPWRFCSLAAPMRREDR
jgi:DNA-3-methyladenine glycosylase